LFIAKKLMLMLQNRVLLLLEVLLYLVSCISSSATAQRCQHLPNFDKVMGILPRG